MSSEFNKPIPFSTIKDDIGIETDITFDFKVLYISDGNKGGENSICAYVKGVLPGKFNNQIILTKENIDGYNCIVTSEPKKTLNDIILYIKEKVGFKNNYSGKTNFDNISIGKNCVIEDNVYIGDGTTIEHNVVIHNGSYIGRNCLIRSGSVIGGEGYGFIKNADGNLLREHFIGDVVINDNVEIGYNCAVVRGLISDTIVGYGVKMDNLVHIAHDCHIGKNATLTAGVSLCGHVHIGEGARLAPNSTVKQRVNIGRSSVIGLGAVILKDVPDEDIMIGNPAKSLKRRAR
ncbi:DapH/DapD/GlmU-related protein [Vibrio proteolyticus]